MTTAQRIAELRRLHTVSIFHGSRSDETTELAIATRNLFPVLLAAWEVAEADSFFKARKTVDPRFREAHERIDEARQAYREALKGLHDA